MQCRRLCALLFVIVLGIVLRFTLFGVPADLRIQQGFRSSVAKSSLNAVMNELQSAATAPYDDPEVEAASSPDELQAELTEESPGNSIGEDTTPSSVSDSVSDLVLPDWVRVLLDTVSSDKSAARQGTFEKKAAFLTHTWLNASLVGTSAGSLHKCQGQVRWAYFAGHFRTFDLNTVNRESFLSSTDGGCWIRVVYTFEEIAHKDQGAYGPESVVKRLEKLQRKGGPLAFLVVRRTIIKGRPDIIPGAVLFGRLVAAFHGVQVSQNDVVLLSRPDILFTNPFNHEEVQQYANNSRPFMFFSRHGKSVGDKDPSEMLIIGTRRVWEDLCVASCPSWRSLRGGACGGESGCLAVGCGLYWGKWVVAGELHKYDSCFYNFGVKFMMHRPPGTVVWLSKEPGRKAYYNRPVTGEKLSLFTGLLCARDDGACDCQHTQYQNTMMKLVGNWKPTTGTAGFASFKDHGKTVGFYSGRVMRYIFDMLDEDGNGVVEPREQNVTRIFSKRGELRETACPRIVNTSTVTWERTSNRRFMGYLVKTFKKHKDLPES